MAKIWPVYEGKEPTRGGPWADIPLPEAIDLFALKKRDFTSGPDKTPRFGDARRDLWYLGYQHVVVEISDNEGRRAKWKPGFYRARIEPKEALRKLIRRAVVAELGEENLMRVDVGPSIDSAGEAAVKVTVVIAPDATKRFADKSVLDAIVRIQQFGEEPTIVVEFATEAELAKSGGSQS